MHDRGIEVLSREQMNNVLGKMMGGSDTSGCTATYSGCNYTPEMGLTCDYWINCPSGASWPVCFATCEKPSDGSACMPDE